MAIYHNRVKIISRSSGRSSVAAVAYRAGEKLKNEYDGKTHNYSHRKDILYSEISLPVNAPIEYLDRSTLWNSVEQVEKQGNAQLAREVEIALPIELNTEQHIKLVKDYVQDNFVSKGMCADFSIHAGHKHTEVDKENPDKVIKKHNPHAHIMLTMRPINADRSWGQKARKEYILDRNGNKIKQKSGNWKSRRIDLVDWDKKETLLKWRKSWADITNKHLEKCGFDERIDHRTLKEQGIDREPQKYMGINYRKEEQNLPNLRVKNEQQAKVELKKYAKKVFTTENNYLSSFSREEIREKGFEIRKFEGSVKWYKMHIQKIEREISDLLLESANTSILKLELRKDIKTRIEKLNDNKEKLQQAFLKKHEIELGNADSIISTQKEQLRVSKNYLEARTLKRDLGNLKYEYIQQTQTPIQQQNLLELENRMMFLEIQEISIRKIANKADYLRQQQTNITEKKGFDIDWETLHREKLTQIILEQIETDINKISGSTFFQKKEIEDKRKQYVQFEEEQYSNSETKRLDRLINNIERNKKYLIDLTQKIDNAPNIVSRKQLEESLKQAVRQIEYEISQIEQQIKRISVKDNIKKIYETKQDKIMEQKQLKTQVIEREFTHER